MKQGFISQRNLDMDTKQLPNRVRRRNPASNPRRIGFTLIELVVVMFITGIMIGLLLPVIHKARSAALRNTCADNLRKIGMLLHTYHTTYGSFPAGVQNPDERPTRPGFPHGYHPWWSWMALATQFYQERDVYQMAHDYAVTDGWWPWGLGSHGPNPALSTQLSIWVCPADDASRYKQTSGSLVAAYTAYLGISGIRDDDSKPGAPPLTPPTIGAPKGVFYLMSKTRIQDITDGTNNTVMVGERPPTNDYNLGWWFAGAGYPGGSAYYFTGRQGGSPPGWLAFAQKGTGDVFLGAREDNFWTWLQSRPEAENDPSCTGPMKIGLQPGGIRSFCDQAHFWSLHPGGAHFLLADASVRFLTYRQDQILPQLATRAGRELPPGP
jgi:type II secretory pathway pseudopilin PulG